MPASDAFTLKKKGHGLGEPMALLLIFCSGILGSKTMSTQAGIPRFGRSHRRRQHRKVFFDRQIKLDQGKYLRFSRSHWVA
jgi:hypothetical protein